MIDNLFAGLLFFGQAFLLLTAISFFAFLIRWSFLAIVDLAIRFGTWAKDKWRSRDRRKQG